MSVASTQVETHRVVGLDGCRAGWIASTFWLRTQPGDSATFEISHIEWNLLRARQDLLGVLQECREAWIDVPIGLASSADENTPKRACDLAVREALGSKRSSIFTPPIREVLEFDSYHEAMLRQHALIRSKCSIQAWNLTPKIRQIDALWDELNHPEKWLHEAHPEWQFQCWAIAMDASKQQRENLSLSLSDSNTSLASKKTAEGRRQRLAILTSQGFVDATTFYEDCLAQTKRKDVQPDDILDAMALALGCYQAINGAGRSFPEGPPPIDIKGRPMAIHYAKP